MKNLVKRLLLSLVAAGIVSCQSLGKPRRLVEFEIKPPKSTEPHGICFAEYQGKEIVVCCFWDSLSVNLKCMQGYDLKGRLLQIPQEELGKCVGNLLESIRFSRRYKLETRELDIPIVEKSLALLDKCIYEDGGCSVDTRKELTLVNAVWKVPLSHYSDFEKTVAVPSDTKWYSKFDFNKLTLPPRSLDSFSPVFTVCDYSRHSPRQFHIWGINGLDGKELAHYSSSRCLEEEDNEPTPHQVFMDSTLQHIVVQVEEGGVFDCYEGLRFYDSPMKFVDGQSCFKYNVQGRIRIDEDECFFISPDIFCFALDSGTRLFTQKCRALLYSFSDNRIIADVKLNHRFSNPCATWPKPWCDISKDRKRLVVAFERTSVAKSIWISIRDKDDWREDFQHWVRIYQLEP